ncbi:MAG: DUF2059 domain-containing protein [Myxococcota bacterium]
MIRCLAAWLAVLITASSAAAEALDSHREAAAELLVLIEIERNMSSMASIMTDSMIQSNPLMAPYRNVIAEWATRTMSWENFRERFISIYMESFSESELRELIAFYRTPTGRKSIEVQPYLMERGAAFGVEVASEHQDELRVMIEKRSKELEAVGSETR